VTLRQNILRSVTEKVTLFCSFLCPDITKAVHWGTEPGLRAELLALMLLIHNKEKFKERENRTKKT
jgi:hypothetical protein